MKTQTFTTHIHYIHMIKTQIDTAVYVSSSFHIHTHAHETLHCQIYIKHIESPLLLLHMSFFKNVC